MIATGRYGKEIFMHLFCRPRFAAGAGMAALSIVCRMIRIASVSLVLGIQFPTIAAAALPALPNVYLDTTYVAPTGVTRPVSAGGDLQAALNAAQPGDLIVLQAGATFTGNFTLPNKGGSGWIYVQSSAYSSLPTPGTRVAPSNASLMPKIVSPNVNSPAITTADGAHHFRFVGI